MKIIVKEKFDEYCIRREQGQNLYILLKAALKMNDTIELDFFNVRITSSDFLDASFGALMKDNNKKNIYTHIKFRHVKPEIERSIKFTIDHFYTYYRDEEFRYVIDAAFGNKSNEEPKSAGKKTRKKDPRPVAVPDVHSMVI